MARPRKRYLLLTWDGGALSSEERKTLARLLELRNGKVTTIPIDGWERNLVVKTDVEGAASIRESLTQIRIGERRVAAVSTSGCIGKLKKRARESGATGVG